MWDRFVKPIMTKSNDTIIMTKRKWKIGLFSMVNMNAALHAQRLTMSDAAATVNKANAADIKQKERSTFQHVMRITVTKIFMKGVYVYI